MDSPAFLRLVCALSFAACSPTVYQHAVPNLVQVDDNVWRSGQITTQAGWDYIKQLAAGRRVHVVKLNFDAEGSDRLAELMGFDVHVYPLEPQGDVDVFDALLNAFRRPSDAMLASAEETLYWAKSTTPTDFYLVHCTHGQDRTGLVIGEHRVLHDGWSKDDAYREMIANHFHPELHGLHETWEDFRP